MLLYSSHSGFKYHEVNWENEKENEIQMLEIIKWKNKFTWESPDQSEAYFGYRDCKWLQQFWAFEKIQLVVVLLEQM